MLLKNCRLIPELTEGYSGAMADILIENGNIAAIGPCGTIAAAEKRCCRGCLTCTPI